MRYNESGKARKLCESCNMYSHARTLVCDCGHEFGKSRIDKKEPVSYNEPGRGRKLCTCGKYIGAKSIICPFCNNVKFEKTTQLQRVTGETPTGKYVGILVYTPSGQCPVSFNGSTREDVFNWCEDVYINGLENNKTYTVNALEYWFNFYNLPHLKKFINEWAIEQGYEKDSEPNDGNEEFAEGENATLLFLGPKE